MSNKMLQGLFIIFTVALTQQASYSQEREKPSMSIKELVSEIRSAKDEQEKSGYMRLLKKSCPQTEEEKQLLIELIDNEDIQLKSAAIVVLAQIKDKRAVPKIIPNLKNKSDDEKNYQQWH